MSIRLDAALAKVTERQVAKRTRRSIVTVNRLDHTPRRIVTACCHRELIAKLVCELHIEDSDIGQ